MRQRHVPDSVVFIDPGAVKGSAPDQGVSHAVRSDQHSAANAASSRTTSVVRVVGQGFLNDNEIPIDYCGK